MNEQQLREVYEMVDNIPFSRTKKNISRDFSDGVMMAELIHHYRPKIVAMHNYPAANSFTKKVNNWNTLNSKVLKKIGLSLPKSHIQDIINSVPLAIETYLYQVLLKFQHPQDQANMMNSHLPQQRVQDQQINSRETHNFGNINVNNGNKKSQIKNINGAETDEVLQLVQQIQQAYAQLQKLQEISKLKDQVIRNLEKKVDRMIFS